MIRTILSIVLAAAAWLAVTGGSAVAASADVADAGGAALAVQPDGKIVVAGSTAGDGGRAFALARYNADGSLDRLFGSEGRVVTAFSEGSARASDLAVAPDGRIVVAGSVANNMWDPRGHDTSDFAVARYDPDGSLDRSFSHDGRLTTDVRDADVAQAVALAPHGRIVAAGYTDPHFSGDTDIAVVRYKRTGRLDTSFSRDGRRVDDFTAGKEPHHDVADAIDVRPDGRILVAGESLIGNGDFGRVNLVRYTRRGALDRSFSGDGKAEPNVCDSAGASDVALQPDGRIVAATSECGFVLARFGADGTLDRSFAENGTVAADFGDDGGAAGIALQPDGRIVAAGHTPAGANGYDFALARVTAGGSLDGSFGAGGRIVTAFEGQVAMANDIALTPGGEIVAAGWTASTVASRDGRIALAAYGADGAPTTGPLTTAFTRGEVERADHTVEVRITGRRVRLRDRRVRFRVTCPAGELSPPCAGTLTIRTAAAVRVHGHTRRLILASQRFAIAGGANGKTRSVLLRLSGSAARLVQRNRTASVVDAIVRAHDAAGNEARLVRRMRLMPAQ